LCELDSLLRLLSLRLVVPFEGLSQDWSALVPLCWWSVEEDYYSTGQAAKILKVSDRGVRKMIDRGELEDSPDERGRHRIPQREVHRLLQERREASPGSAGEADATESPQASQEAAELRARVEQLQRDLGRLEGRLELTAQAESTLRDQLDRERAELERERGLREQEREKAEAEQVRLREELEEVREAASRSWWQRLWDG
jgi:excisionase family DNA binding protein